MSEAQRVGITPYVTRLAAYYASLGIGEYVPKGYGFDRVVVQVKQPWTADPSSVMKSMLVLEVAFFSNGRQQRYVEFALIPAGFGGEPIMKVVE